MSDTSDAVVTAMERVTTVKAAVEAAAYAAVDNGCSAGPELMDILYRMFIVSRELRKAQALWEFQFFWANNPDNDKRLLPTMTASAERASEAALREFRKVFGPL